MIRWCRLCRRIEQKRRAFLSGSEEARRFESALAERVKILVKLREGLQYRSLVFHSQLV